MKHRSRLLKVLLFSAFGLVLSTMVGLQAATNVLAVKQPALAVGLFPLDGFALERIAVHRMATSEQSSVKMSQLAGELEPVVVEAFRKEPLVPNALAILALAQKDESIRDNILIATSQINRRRLILQTQLLSLYASREDFDGTIGKLNEILAVHPEQRPVYLPALVQALRDPRAVEPLVGVLEQAPDWSDQYLVSAASDNQSLDNLNRLRNMLDNKIEPKPETDRTIILKMANGGKIEHAYSLYQKFVSGKGSNNAKSAFGTLNWRSEYPPFDWQLSENNDERADIASNDQGLDIKVKRGKGGIVAQRLLPTPTKPFKFRIEHSGISTPTLDDVFFEWGCEGDDEQAKRQSFSQSPMEIVVNQPADCQLHRIGINARAWSHKGDFSGRVLSIAIKPI